MITGKNNPITAVSDREIVITRVINAPREQCRQAWGLVHREHYQKKRRSER